MPIGKLRYCWDSCVFISLLTGTGRTKEELDNLRKLEALSDAGSITIFTPAITLAEVLSCKLTDQQEKSFSELLQRSNVYPVSVTMRIAGIAREIRNYYRLQELEIAVPDAIHLATAIHYSATALHTYDGCGKRARKTDLLRLATPVIGVYPLKICKPEPPPADRPEPPIPSNAETGNLFDESEAMENTDGKYLEEEASEKG